MQANFILLFGLFVDYDTQAGAETKGNNTEKTGEVESQLDRFYPSKQAPLHYKRRKLLMKAHTLHTSAHATEYPWAKSVASGGQKAARAIEMSRTAKN